MVSEQRRRRAFSGAILLAMLCGGCSIKAPAVRWQTLADQPESRRVALADVVERLRAVALPVPGRVEVRNPIVVLEEVASYAKLLRLGPVPGGHAEIVVESWCDCPVMAVLRGAPQLPVFMPRLTLLNARAEPLETIQGEARGQEPLFRNMPIKGTWQVEVGGGLRADHVGAWRLLRPRHRQQHRGLRGLARRPPARHGAGGAAALSARFARSRPLTSAAAPTASRPA